MGEQLPEQLPEPLRSIYRPKSKVRRVRKVSDTEIRVWVTYDNEVDVWKLENGRWTFQNCK